MFKWLKRHFIPHPGNKYRPHFLHSHNVRHLLSILLFFELVLFILPVFNFFQVFNTLNLGSVLPGVLATLTNQEREKNNLPGLAVNPVLQQAAQLKAEDMAAKSYFAHTSPEGLTPWYWFEKAGYRYSYAGENLAINFTDSEDVTHAWMNSPAHRANIVSAGYTEVGTGIATGVYQGRETIFVAQVYGKPAPIPKLTTSTKQANSISSPASGGFRRDNNLPTLSPSPTTQVLGESQAPISKPASIEKALKSPSFIQKVFSAPRQVTNAMLYVVLSLILVALFLEIAIKSEYQHMDLVTNAAVVAVVVMGIYIGNGYIADRNMQTTFIAFNYSQAHESL
ncbi:MAG: CAP domain-containing protein [Patescibacteria group bacterium]